VAVSAEALIFRPIAGVDHRAYRLTSIDLLRGLVIVIMALDHVRDFFQAGRTMDFMDDPNVSTLLYFTRWITHFCAPVFVFLAGTSAGLMVARKSRTELGTLLLTRGLWLIFIEWFVIATAWTFAPFGSETFGGKTFVLLQVIWAIGASMVVLAACQFLGREICLALGLVIVLGHNSLDYGWPAPESYAPGTTPLWISLHARMREVVGPFLVSFSYPVIPWIGVMLCGFGASLLFEKPAAQRDRLLLRYGTALIAAFFVLRALDIYGDPNHWQAQPVRALSTVFDFLNTTKYPPSLLYLLMTLGPAAVLCSFAERWSGWLSDTLVMLGRVPFAFYVAHLFLIHALSILLGVLQGFPAADFLTVGFLYPKGYGLSLVGVYITWVLVLVLLYPFCKRVAAAKARSRAWWLSYV
jgi:uncharacterized membrane protein